MYLEESSLSVEANNYYWGIRNAGGSKMEIGGVGRMNVAAAVRFVFALRRKPQTKEERCSSLPTARNGGGYYNTTYDDE